MDLPAERLPTMDLIRAQLERAQAAQAAVVTYARALATGAQLDRTEIAALIKCVEIERAALASAAIPSEI